MMLALLTMVGMTAFAQEVVLDFTKAATEWGIPSDAATTEAKDFTNGTYTVTFGKGAKANTGYVLFGKQGAYITLPVFDFPVQAVELEGRSGASASTKMNIFCGDEAIGTETTGCTGANKYDIPESYQNGKQFTLKVLSSHNAQVTKINIYKVGGEGPIDISNTLETAYSVSKAIELIDAGKSLTTKVYVAGKITAIKEISVANGNATYTISDGEKDLIVYRGYDFKGNKFTADNALQVDDEVVVYGNLTKYNEDYEVAQGSELVTLNGEGYKEQPLELVGDGSAEKPYTVADVIALYDAKKNTADKVWIKGTIGGWYGSDNKLKTEATEDAPAVAANLALVEGEKSIPVQLASGTAIRDVLNVLYNPYNMGLECAVQGEITAYFGGAGVKNLTDKVINQPEVVIPEGYNVLSVGDLQANWVKNGEKNNVEISFVTPSKMMTPDFEVEDLTFPITKVVVTRTIANDYESEPVLVAEFNAPGIGRPMTVTDKDLAFGQYSYLVKTYYGDVEDWGSEQPVIVGQIAAMLTEEEFTATVGSFNTRQITFDVTLPTMDMMGEELTAPITKLIISEVNMMTGIEMPIFVEEDAEILLPGTKLQYQIEDANDGNHMYFAKVYTAAGPNDAAMVNVFIGHDLPGMVENLNAEETEDGILISWEAPSIGMNGGDMGDDIWYNVYRGTSEWDPAPVEIAKGIKELSVVDKPEFTEESKFVYIVYAESEFGQGYGNVTREFMMGPASQLPFYENFDVVADVYGNTAPEHSTWSKDEYEGSYNAWQIGQSAFMGEDIAPHNGAGLLYAYYDAWMTNNKWDMYKSGSIDFTSAEQPTMTFWLYDVKREASDMSLVVLTTADDVEYTEALNIQLGNAEADGWRQVTVDLAALKGAAKGKVAFKSVSAGPESFAVIVDEIAILAKPEDETAIAGVKAMYGAEAAYNLMGQRVRNNTRGIVVVGGKKMLNK